MFGFVSRHDTVFLDAFDHFCTGLDSLYYSHHIKSDSKNKDQIMASPALLQTIITLSDLLTAAALMTVWIALVRNRRDGAGTLAIAGMVLIALGWAALWAWYPPLSAMRLNPPPGGQVAAILTLVVGLPALLVFGTVRRLFASINPASLVVLGPWRIVFGSILWVLGALGGLPKAFFLTAGLGDIVVGLWAIAILTRRTSARPGEVIAWNIVGLVDLLHVLVLAAINLRPFYLNQPAIPPANLLPLVGVPTFIAIHVMTLWAIVHASKRPDIAAR
jgi:hypothetical protein